MIHDGLRGPRGAPVPVVVVAAFCNVAVMREDWRSPIGVEDRLQLLERCKPPAPPLMRRCCRLVPTADGVIVAGIVAACCAYFEGIVEASPFCGKQSSSLESVLSVCLQVVDELVVEGCWSRFVPDDVQRLCRE
eukprot:6466864-Heterocapsa_arctica.AAC.1